MFFNLTLSIYNWLCNLPFISCICLCISCPLGVYLMLHNIMIFSYILVLYVYVSCSLGVYLHIGMSQACPSWQWQWHRTRYSWSPVWTLQVAPLWCDLGRCSRTVMVIKLWWTSAFIYHLKKRPWQVRISRDIHTLTPLLPSASTDGIDVGWVEILPLQKGEDILQFVHCPTELLMSGAAWLTKDITK